MTKGHEDAMDQVRAAMAGYCVKASVEGRIVLLERADDPEWPEKMTQKLQYVRIERFREHPGGGGAFVYEVPSAETVMLELVLAKRSPEDAT